MSTVEQALLAEAAGKSGMCWLTLPKLKTPRAVWHVWHDAAPHVVGGGIEQPLPGLDELESVEVTVRSKDNSSRILRMRASVQLIAPDDPNYSEAVTALAASRLNAGAQDATEQWLATSQVFRLEPVEVIERPGMFDPESHAAPPAPTNASTAPMRPLTLHRRARRKPPLT